MKSLQQYILEAVETDETLNEGKIWDAIKKWWNDIFEPSDKKYDRYASEMDETTKINFKNELKDSFKIQNLTVKKINPSSLQSIIEPNGEKPNKETNTGFWKFVDETYKDDGKTIFYALTYITNDIKDTPVLIKLTPSKLELYEDYVELNNIQIIEEYSTVLPLNKLIDYIFDSSQILNNYKGIIYFKSTDNAFYNKLNNDCDFIKETVNDKKLVKRDK